MSNPGLKLYLEPELADQVAGAVAQFRAAGRKVSRNEVLVQLIEDGFRSWRKEAQIVNRVEATIGKLLDRSARHDVLLRSVLLSLAEGDKAEVAEMISTIEKEDKANA
jgi:hypothetical protein